MTSLGRLPAYPGGLFAEHRRRFAIAQVLVQLFYVLGLLRVDRILTNLNNLPKFDAYWLWPLTWISHFDGTRGLALALVCSASLIVTGAVFHRHRWGRVSAMWGYLLSVALENSGRQFNHHSYALIFISFILIFLPSDRGAQSQPSVTTRQKYLLVFASAQAVFLMTYSLSGYWKIIDVVQQIAAGTPHNFSLEGLGAQLAFRVLQTGHEAYFAAAIINHPWVGWTLNTACIYFQFFSLLIVFRPRLHRWWGALAIAFHLGTVATMDLTFYPHITLACLFLLASPFDGPCPLKRRVRELPMLRFVFSCINARSRSFPHSKGLSPDGETRS